MVSTKKNTVVEKSRTERASQRPYHTWLSPWVKRPCTDSSELVRIRSAVGRRAREPLPGNVSSGRGGHQNRCRQSNRGTFQTKSHSDVIASDLGRPIARRATQHSCFRQSSHLPSSITWTLAYASASLHLPEQEQPAADNSHLSSLHRS